MTIHLSIPLHLSENCDQVKLIFRLQVINKYIINLNQGIDKD